MHLVKFAGALLRNTWGQEPCDACSSTRYRRDAQNRTENRTELGLSRWDGETPSAHACDGLGRIGHRVGAKKTLPTYKPSVKPVAQPVKDSCPQRPTSWEGA